LVNLRISQINGCVPQRVPSDADLHEMRRHFSDGQIAELTFVVGAIRAWNMLNATFHMPVPEVPSCHNGQWRCIDRGSRKRP